MSMTVADERMDTGTPQVIRDLFEMPYQWAATMMTGRILDVGGGELRLGKHLLGPGVTDVDADPACGNDVTASATALPFEDASFDHAVCLETIEHIETPLAVVSELVRVTRGSILVGSVNAGGPNWLPGGVAIWKGPDNPFHVNEMNTDQFVRLFAGLPVRFYSAVLMRFPRLRFAIADGAHPGALVNYALITPGDGG